MQCKWRTYIAGDNGFLHRPKKEGAVKQFPSAGRYASHEAKNLVHCTSKYCWVLAAERADVKRLTTFVRMSMCYNPKYRTKCVYMYVCVH